MDTTARQALMAIAAHSRSLAETIEGILSDSSNSAHDTTDRHQGGEAQRSGPCTAHQGTPDTEPVSTWDPEVDPPLVVPKVVGTREEQDWCCLTYLGGIYAINKRYNRGATRDEVRKYAMKAGYQDGRAVTAWSKGNGATQNDPDKQRWVNEAGANGWVKGLAEKLGVTLPADLAEPWEAPDFRSGPSGQGSETKAAAPQGRA